MSNNFLQKAADKLGFLRQINGNEIPDNLSKITVVPLFGDIRANVVLSSLFLKEFRQNRKDKYIIVCSWPGHKVLYPGVDEYWSVSDVKLAEEAYFYSKGFNNNSSLVSGYFKNLSYYFFEDVVHPDEWTKFYNNGITENFWSSHEEVNKFLPQISSGADLPRELIKSESNKVFVYPTKYINLWWLGNQRIANLPKDFWLCFIEELLKMDIKPVVYKGFLTHDISSDFTSKCLYVNDLELSKALGAMRYVGCVVDFFGGISRLAVLARTPYFAYDERSRYFNFKEYEIDDICAIGIPRKYIFSFPTIIESGNKDAWLSSILSIFKNEFFEFFSLLKREEWPLCSEVNESISRKFIREKKFLSMGIKFLKNAKKRK